MLNILFGKKPQTNTIRKAAEHLIAIYGTTTTLEVKKYLRAQGYLVFQRDVSQKMDRIGSTCGWAFQFNGHFRIYYIPQLQPLASANYAVPAFSIN